MLLFRIINNMSSVTVLSEISAAILLSCYFYDFYAICFDYVISIYDSILITIDLLKIKSEEPLNETLLTFIMSIGKYIQILSITYI